MQAYRHTQIGTLMLWSVGIGAGVAVLIAAREPEGLVVVAVVAAVALLLLALFGSLTVEVTERGVSVAFGAGLIRRRYAAEEITDARIVRNRWWYGWGIRLTPHGWLFNVAGLDAVEIELRSGKKVRIGTDDPQRLHMAIRQACRF